MKKIATIAIILILSLCVCGTTKVFAESTSTSIIDAENESQLIRIKESATKSLDDYKKANRGDIVSKIEKEIEILTEYLPEQLTLDEIKKLVSEAIEKTGAASPRDMGKVMQEIRPKIAGKADGKVVSDMVKQMLA